MVPLVKWCFDSLTTLLVAQGRCALICFITFQKNTGKLVLYVFDYFAVTL